MDPKVIRAAVARAIPTLERSAAKFVEQRSCFSCHHNALPILALHAARQRGFATDDRILSALEDKTFRPLNGESSLDDAVQGINLSDPTPNDSYLLMAAGAAGVKRSLATGVLANRMARWQRDGHWITSDFRPPHSGSVFAATATAIRALRTYMPDELAAERETAIERARQWLIQTPAGSTEDAAFRLMGLAWAGASANDRDAASRELFSRQTASGGWPQTANYDVDAYSTGEALFALKEAGVDTGDANWQKGVKYLISTEARDGSWRVATRMVSPAEVSPPYFSTGFPYGKDEFISYAGTCWAVMALTAAIPEDTPSRAVGNAPDPSPWVRTALFGSREELERRINGGLDPDAKTPGGTTLLMMAAPDSEKVRLLLSRGADGKARTGGNSDALAIASGYRGTAASLTALLNVGAPAEPPEDIHVRHTPLALASMTGDLETVRLLLSRGARPSAEALSEAVTFGYPDVVAELIKAGADVGIAESSGINLLHWAAITGRSSLIPALVRAGVALNAQDQSGFTPLMYAAILDTGPADLVATLLGAGADRRIRNKAGRTALDEARRHKRAAAVDALQ